MPRILPKLRKKSAAKPPSSSSIPTTRDETMMMTGHRIPPALLVVALLSVPCLLFGGRGTESSIFQDVKIRATSAGTRAISTFSQYATTTTTTTTTTEDDFPSDSLIQGARQFVTEREHAYQLDGQHKEWKMRGHGWLSHYRKVILAARVQGDTLKIGRNSVSIWNVHPEADSLSFECDKLLLWVRVNGPEVLAGKAIPVMSPSSSSTTTDNIPTSCHWEFLFDLERTGTYTIDAKTLLWNGRAHLQHYKHGDELGNNQCQHTEAGNNLTQAQLEQAPQQASLIGFKLYTPVAACCEVCRRTPGCQYWATPPSLLPKPSKPQNGCELYFGKDVAPEDVPVTRLIHDITRQQIQDLKRVQATEAQREAKQKQLEAEEAQKVAQEAQEAANQALAGLQEDKDVAIQQLQPLQRRLQQQVLVPYAHGSPDSLQEDTAFFVGCGWSFQFTLEFPCLSGDLDDWIYMEQHEYEVVDDSQEATPPTKQQEDLPLCTSHDEYMTFNNKTKVGRWVREPLPTTEQCPQPYTVHEEYTKSHEVSRHDGDHPHCWHVTDLTPLNKRCMELNCGLIKPHHKWNASTIQHENRWNAVYRNYHCDYMEFTNDQLSQCFQQLRISKLETEGASISAMLKQYFLLRLENVPIYNDDNDDAQKVLVTTLQWSHHLWKKSAPGWKEMVEQLPDQTPGQAFWISPFFVTSEREPNVQLERAMEFTELVEPLLQQKGYQTINVLDLSAALSYDVAGQGDGLHILGPPMKMAVTKVFHHLCSGVIEGSRV